MLQFTLIIMVLIFVFATAIPTVAAYEHNQLFSGKFKHEPVEGDDCITCHDLHSQETGNVLIEPVPGLCYDCHDDFSGRVIHDPVKKGRCLSCHAPHSSSIDKLLTKGISSLCTGCHEDRKNGQHGPSRYSDICTECHDVHSSDSEHLLVPVSGSNCESCHPGTKRGTFTHTALEEYECDECHDPHSTVPEPPLSCEECHDDLTAGSILHAPLEDGCSDCHGTHNGPEKFQLLMPPFKLCMECHDDMENGQHGEIYLGTDCVTCHNPHSTDLNSLLKSSTLTPPCGSCHVRMINKLVQHTPVRDGRCERCHDPHRNNQVQELKCNDCHDKILSGQYTHEAAEDSCSNCHATHSAHEPYQLLSEIPDVCIECHDDKVRGRHGRVTTNENCITCHSPHSSAQPKLLTKTVNLQACESCHTDHKSRPVVHPPVEVEQCATCHNPHAFPPVNTTACTDCHDDLLAGKFIHEPAAEDCSECHETHSGENESMLHSEYPDLCIDCHFDKEEGVHDRSRMSMVCLSCHDPHSEQQRGLLKIDIGGRRCASCHVDKEASEYQHTALKKYGCEACHNPHSDPPEMPPISCIQCHMNIADKSPLHSMKVQGRCTDCHDPHDSDNKFILVDTGLITEEECLDCHQNIGRKLERGSTKHEPAEDGECTTCHTIHSGTPPFTVEEFAADMNVPYEQTAYELCFGCHDYTLIQAKYSESDTRFRNGSNNLHYVHVVRDGEKGFSCWVCHDMHASNQPHLLNRENPYNPSYRLKIKFRVKENGGECKTNCHTKREYQR